MKELTFDVVIHIVGRQTVPNYMAMKLSEASQHLLVASNETQHWADLLGRVSRDEGRTISVLTVPAMDYVMIRNEVSDWLRKNAFHRVGVNITGGTKPMSAALLDVCRESDMTPFYIDTDHRKIYFFKEPYLAVDMPPVFDKVSDYVRIAGYCLSDIGIEARQLPIHRRALLRSMWQCRKKLADATKLFARAAKPREWRLGESAKSLYSEAVGKLERLSQQSSVDSPLIGNWHTEFPEYSDEAARIGAGVWFEQWLLAQFADSKHSERFLDLRSGLKLKLSDESDKDAQEIDLAFTDGYRLWLFECKSGDVFQEHIQKLENISRNLGGVMGRGVLCTVHKPHNEVVMQRISFGDITLVTEDALTRLVTNIEKVSSRRTYERASDFDRHIS